MEIKDASPVIGINSSDVNAQENCDDQLDSEAVLIASIMFSI